MQRLVVHNERIIEVTLMGGEVPPECLNDAKRDRFQVITKNCWLKPYDASLYSNLRSDDHWISRYGYLLNPAVGLLPRQVGQANCVLEVQVKKPQDIQVWLASEEDGQRAYSYSSSMVNSDPNCLYPTIGKAELAALLQLHAKYPELNLL